MALSFRGGIWLAGSDQAADLPFETVPAPERATLTFTAGAGQRAVCEEGARVLRGEAIVAAQDERHAPLHAPFSGTVTRVTGGSVLIENDQKNEADPRLNPFDTPLSQAQPEALAAFIREAGLTDPGRSDAPLAGSVTAARGTVKRLIVSCVETEPDLFSAYRLIMEKTREIVNGAKILLRATGAQKAVFVVEKTHEKAVEALLAICGSSESFGVCVVKSKYPQEQERALVRAVTGRALKRGKTALESGYFLVGAECVYAVYRAFVTGEPETARYLSVSGDCLERPHNLLVPLGTSFEDVVRFCGGLVKKPALALESGVMTGRALPDLTAGVGKMTRGLVLLSESFDPPVTACIRCGRCAGVCPERLLPLRIARAVDRGAWKSAASWDPEACTECGACAYVCPAGIPLLEKIRRAKDPPKKGEE